MDGETRKLPDPFFVIATQNPVEQIGAYPLPESQLDRFLMAIELGYPDAAAERELLAGGDRRARIAELAAARRSADAARMAARSGGGPRRAGAARLRAGAARRDARQRSGARHGDAGARRGLSPRAGLMLLAAARAWALVGGRPMVLPEDVQAVFPSVAGHRLAGGARAGALQAQALLRAVPLPVADRRHRDRRDDHADRDADATPRRPRGSRACASALFRHAPADREPRRAAPSRIYILPTRRGWR